MKSVTNIAKPRTAPKAGRFATPRSILRVKGSGMFKAAGRDGGSGPGVLVSAVARIVAAFVAGTGLLVAVPAVAGGYAVHAPENVFSSAPGLPDDRVYELVSPANDDGNQAGAIVEQTDGGVPADEAFGLASAGGNSALFEGTGPMGETASAGMLDFVATRTSSGWRTRSVLPDPEQPVEPIGGGPGAIYLSQDFSHAVVSAGRYTLAPLPDGERCYGQLYLTGPDPFVAATWLSQSQTGSPAEVCDGNGTPIGGSPDLSTVYFTYSGTLLPEDAARAPHLPPQSAGDEAPGFYEDADGVLHEAAVLPDGALDPFGAVPAGTSQGLTQVPISLDNQVSADGSRAFFVSPDPATCEQSGGKDNCAVDPPELYVHESGAKTLLVSKDTLLPETGRLPASAPDGPVPVNTVAIGDPYESKFNGQARPYVFASSDGSQAFFQSEDQLTAGALEGPPGNTSVKTYDFDVDTGVLTYLPGVVGKLVGTDVDGSVLAFVRPGTGSAPAELDLWSAGAGGGSVTPVVQLTEGEDVEPVRVSSDGSVVVFMASGLPGFNDAASSTIQDGRQASANGVQQIFRYEAATNMLGCVSCSPASVAPSPASMSALRRVLFYTPGVVDERGVSVDGDRVFFQTQAPLVPADTNTGTSVAASEHKGRDAAGMDVYEWENGVVYLISTGKSAENSWFLDNSESGNDVFFATAEGLVASDTDGGYSVYDARVPRPGDNPPPAAVPCEGAVCQGPPRVPSPLGAPASATFSGLGNVVPEPVVTPAVVKKPVVKLVKCKKGYVRKKATCVKRSKGKSSAKGRK